MSDYQIRIKGQIDPKLAAWFDGFEMKPTPEGDTLLTGLSIDQAALHGVLTRCRDLGVTLISINPLAKKGANEMSNVHSEATQVIEASPEKIYAVLTDYRVGHPAILPKKYFTDLTIEKGGKGAGTVLIVKMNIYGNKYEYHQIVSEPEPNRVLVEANLDGALTTQFTIEPLDGGRKSRVTISTNSKASPGLAGWVERLMQPSIAGKIYREELQNLAEYVTA